MHIFSVRVTCTRLSKKSILPAKRAFKIIFCHGSPGAKNTSNHTSVRIVGIADNECAQCGCSAEKSQRDFFDGLTCT